MMLKYVLAIVLLTHLVAGQTVTRTRTRTRTTTVRKEVITPGVTRTITLSGGELLTIDSETLERLQQQGVDINNLQNLTEADLEALGITLTTSSVNIGSDVSGTQTITLRGGQILTIDTATLQRLQSEGVDINNLQNLSEAELEELGIVLTTRTVSTGTRTTTRITRVPAGTIRVITLRGGQRITLDSVTLQTLVDQGYDIDQLETIDEAELERLGVITTTRTVTLNRVDRPQVTRVGVVATTTGRRDSGIEVIAAPRPRPSALPVAPLAPRGGGARPRPPPPAPQPPAEEEEEANPKPEPYSFSYTSETEDGSVSEREESQDANGVITGFYTLRDQDGNNRRVDYIADENGYRATITTNEIGTESQSPANVDLQSSAPTAEELSRQYTAEQEQLALQNRPRGGPPRRGSLSGSRDNEQRRSAAQRQPTSANIEIIRPVSSEASSATRTETRSGRVVLTLNRAEPSEPVARFVAQSSERSAAQSRYGTKI